MHLGKKLLIVLESMMKPLSHSHLVSVCKVVISKSNLQSADGIMLAGQAWQDRSVES